MSEPKYRWRRAGISWSLLNAHTECTGSTDKPDTPASASSCQLDYLSKRPLRPTPYLGGPNFGFSLAMRSRADNRVNRRIQSSRASHASRSV